MDANRQKSIRRRRRKAGIRKRIVGTSELPRLSVYRSVAHIYAQVIDDLAGKTIASASSIQGKLDQGGNCAAAKEVGKLIGERAKAAGVTKIAFDRNGFRYHGRVKALADSAREQGLEF